MSASVKGIFVAGAVSSVRKAIKDGQVTREQVELRLEPTEVPFLDEKVDAALWYPVATLGHFLDVLADVMPGEREQAYVEIGRAAADMAARTGRYGQLDPSRKAGESATEVLRHGRLVTSVITAFYDFSRMSFGPDPADPAAFQIDWFDVADLPESNRHCAQGFIERIAHHAAHADMVVTSQRPWRPHAAAQARGGARHGAARHDAGRLLRVR